MRKLGIMGLAVAALFATTAIGRSGDRREAPAPLTMHISIRSPWDCVEKLDQFVASVTEGTRNTIPYGMVSMLAKMYMPPLPDEAWRNDREIHVYIPKRPMPPLVVINVESFDAFLDAVSGNGGEVEALEEDGPGRAAQIRMGGSGVAALDLGDGKVALGAMPGVMRMTLGMTGSDGKAWLPPTPPGDWDVSLAVYVPALRDTLNLGSLISEIRANNDRDADAAVKAGLNRRAIEGLLEALPEYLEYIDAEIGMCRSLSMDFRFLEDGLRMAIRPEVDEGSIFKEIALGLEGLADAKAPLAEKVGNGPLSLAVTSSPSRYIKNFPERLAAFMGVLTRKSFPDLGDRPEQAVRGLFAHGEGDGVVLNYAARGDNSYYSAVYAASDNPAASIAANDAFYALIGEMAALSVDKPEYRISFPKETGSAGGYDFHRYHLQLGDPEGLKNLLQKINHEAPELAASLNPLLDFSIYLGSRDGMVVTVSGKAGEDEFVAAMKEIDGTAKPFLANESFARGLGEVGRHQATIGALDPDGFFRIILRQMLGNLGDIYLKGRENLYLKAFDAALPDMAASGEIIVSGLGAQDGQLFLGMVIPTGAINAMIRNYELYDSTMKSDARFRNPDGSLLDGLDDSEIHDEDEWEGDLDDEEYEEEEFELDEPAGAS